MTGAGAAHLGEPGQPALSPVRRQEGSAFQATPRATKPEGDAESHSWPPADLPGSTRWTGDVHDNWGVRAAVLRSGRGRRAGDQACSHFPDTCVSWAGVTTTQTGPIRQREMGACSDAFP